MRARSPNPGAFDATMFAPSRAGYHDAWLAEWESLGLPDEVNRAVLVDNISRLLSPDG